VAAIAHCDTHTVLWLYAGEIERLSKKAADAIETFNLMISPMVRLEMQFLNEIGRINEKPQRILRALMADFGIRVCNDPFESVIEAAEAIHWTRDPFDRIIVAQATLERAPLITKDDVLRKYYKPCIW
jgi:PIN domain nuclease of toxin-antitoxin system